MFFIFRFVELLVPGGELGLTAIRTFRVLRPLRMINRVPSLRILVSILLDTLPMLSNVFLICFITFFVFGVLGVELWKGKLRNRCFLELNSSNIDQYRIFEFVAEDPIRFSLFSFDFFQ